MTVPAKKAQAFLDDLRALMVKHGVQAITAADHYQGYPECGSDIRITVEFRYDPGSDYNDVDVIAIYEDNVLFCGRAGA